MEKLRVAPSSIWLGGGGGGELKHLGTLPFWDPSKSFPESKTFSGKRRGEGGLLFPKTKCPKIFSKTLVLHNGGLNLVFKTLFYFSLGGGGGYSPGHGKTSGVVAWLGCGKSDGRAWQVRNCYSINLSWVRHCHTLQPGLCNGLSSSFETNRWMYIYPWDSKTLVKVFQTHRLWDTSEKSRLQSPIQFFQSRQPFWDCFRRRSSSQALAAKHAPGNWKNYS
jgi:hypothetical protein